MDKTSFRHYGRCHKFIVCPSIFRSTRIDCTPLPVEQSSVMDHFGHSLLVLQFYQCICKKWEGVISGIQLFSINDWGVVRFRQFSLWNVLDREWVKSLGRGKCREAQGIGTWCYLKSICYGVTHTVMRVEKGLRTRSRIFQKGVQETND